MDSGDNYRNKVNFIPRVIIETAISVHYYTVLITIVEGRVNLVDSFLICCFVNLDFVYVQQDFLIFNDLDFYYTHLYFDQLYFNEHDLRRITRNTCYVDFIVTYVLIDSDLQMYTNEDFSKGVVKTVKI